MGPREAIKLLKNVNGNIERKKLKIEYNLRQLEAERINIEHDDAKKLEKNIKLNNKRSHYWSKQKDDARFQITITANEIMEIYEEQGGLDYWTKTQLYPMLVHEPHCPMAMSLDRKNGKLGYTKDNCVLTARFVNLGRGSCPMDEFVKWLPMLIKHMSTSKYKPHDLSIWQ